MWVEQEHPGRLSSNSPSDIVREHVEQLKDSYMGNNNPEENDRLREYGLGEGFT
jgi:hypothetical protein